MSEKESALSNVSMFFLGCAGLVFGFAMLIGGWMFVTFVGFKFLRWFGFI